MVLRRVQLLYTAEMKRSIYESLDDKKRAVNALLERLALTPCK